MYRAYLPRRHRHGMRVPTAAGFRRPPQPAWIGLTLRGSTGMWVLPQLDFAWLSQPGEAPSCIGLTSRGGTGMRDPPQLGFAVLPSQPRDW